MKSPRDRFDDIPRTSGRVGAHRAEQPGMNGLVVLLWSAAVALVLIVVGIFVTLLMMGRISVFSAPDDGAAGTPGVVAQLDTSYRVMVLNATPETGLVANVRETLLAEGWSDDLVFGSDGATDEFDKTTVFYVDKADESAALGLAQLLDDADVAQSDFYAALNDTELPQLTVVIGLDRVADGGSETDAPDEAPAG